MIPSDEQLPNLFPFAEEYEESQLTLDVQRAIVNRPELRFLDFERRQLEVELEQARNLLLPSIDATIVGSQDMGQATSKKRDKSEFELEAGLLLQVPIQRREASGKILSLEAKLAQLAAKRGFTEDKITTEVQNAVVALGAAFQQIERAHRSLELARELEVAERRKFELGDSNLLLVNLREQAAADAAFIEIAAKQEFFRARASLNAATARDVETAPQP